MHHAKENLFSTLSKVACPSDPAISHTEAAIIHPVLMSMLAKIHCGWYHATVPHHWPSVLLPLPTLLQQLCHHHLMVLVTDAIDASQVLLLPALGFFFLFQTKNNTRCVPLRHHRRQRNSPVASYSNLCFKLGFRKNTSVTIFHELGASI